MHGTPRTSLVHPPHGGLSEPDAGRHDVDSEAFLRELLPYAFSILSHLFFLVNIITNIFR